MKKTLISLLALCCTMAAQAQNEQMTATLQHGDETQVFTGANAFVNAHTAAEDGDVITLSEGVFAVTPITKSVSIYGAGFETDETNGTGVTKLDGSLYIGVEGETLKDVLLEGLYVNGETYAATNSSNSTNAPMEGLTINKCYLGSYLLFRSNITNATIKNCVVSNGYYESVRGASTDVVATNLYISNCVLANTVNTFNETSTICVDHSIVLGTYYRTAPSITWMNTIFTAKVESRIFGAGYAKNCIFRSDRAWNQGIGNFTQENCYEVEMASIFSDAADGNYSATRTYELQQPETWIGTDDTEIGIRGGEGWSKVPSTPVVKSLGLSVSGKTLNVTYDAVVR